MGIVYVLTLIILGIAFMMFKKSDEKLNFIKWLIIFLVSIYGYNIVLGMVLGLLNITSHIWLLSIINLCFAFGLGFKAFKNKDIQKYFVRKQDIAGIIVILIIFGVMFVKDLYIFKGDITHFAVDSAIHYRAAKHYSDNLKIFINVEDKTFFNFNVMQTGAYINDGIFMNVVHSITGIEYCYLYQAFETMTLFLSGLAFYTIFIDKIKTKRGFVLSFILFGLYMYGYPYNSWIYGFSYLSVGIVMIAQLVSVVECLYSTEKIKKWFIITLIGMLATGLIFSYCLFVPAVFAAICIYTFLKDFKEDGKTYLKFFKKTTLIVTGMLLLITASGIGYLFVPTFFIEGQTDLVSALKIDGAIYSGKYADLIPYVPFAIMYGILLIKKIIKKELRYFDIFSVLMIGYLVLAQIGNIKGKVSLYYLFKIYYVVWMVVLGVTIDVVNELIDVKIIKWIIPLYVVLWAGFVCVWVLIKAGGVIGEEEKHALPNYVGMYYMENCEYRKLIDMTQNFNKNQVEILTYAKNNIDDITVENTELLTEGYYQRIWATVLSEIHSDNYTYDQVTQDTRIHTLEEAIEDTRKEYVICTSRADNIIAEYEKYKSSDKVEILFSNEGGYVAKINH